MLFNIYLRIPIKKPYYSLNLKENNLIIYNFCFVDDDKPICFMVLNCYDSYQLYEEELDL